jgi:hypothetical protein
MSARALPLVIAAAVGPGVAWADGADPEPPAAVEVRSHKGQLGLAVSLLTGGRFIKTYDQEYCGARDDNGNTSGNSAVCIGRIPFAFDLSASYGVTAKIELLFDLRLGVERDFGGSGQRQRRPAAAPLRPGREVLLRRPRPDEVLLDRRSWRSTRPATPAPAAASSAPTCRSATPTACLLDFHDAYGAYLFFAEDVAFRRWISVGIEFGAGFQGRYP